jgi:ABC-2 type transport system ATP-binding protein
MAVRAVAEAPPPLAADAPGLLEIAGVRHSWRRQPRPILDDVSVSVPAGSIAWIRGGNGAGKTTLLRIAAGILIPEAGHVSFDGLDPVHDRLAYQRRLGFLSAGDRGLHNRLTTLRQLRYWARLAYVPRDEIDGRIHQVVETLGLGPLLDKRLDRISMGQRQRVRLALAFLHRPDLILLDEPRNSLDDAGYERLRATVLGAANRGAAIVWCSPSGEDNVLPYDAGYIVEDGRLERIS